jgi:hypothetical protein
LIRFLSNLRNKSISSSIEVNGDVIRDISPLKKTGSFVSSGNNVSFCGYINSKKVKIYKTHNNDSLKLRLKINNIFRSENICFSFPDIIGVDRNFIIEEWIDGHVINESNLHKEIVINFLKSSSVIDYNNDFFKNFNGFSYFDNFLLNRLNHINFIYKIPNIIDDWLNFRKKYEHISKFISHNDLTQANIIQRNNSFYIIDNEFLTYGDCHLLNYYNSRVTPFNDTDKFVHKTIHVREICSNYFRNSIRKMSYYIDSYPYD